MERIRSLCRARGMTVTGALAKAGVSRNAFYSLARRDSILPRTLRALGAGLGVEPEALLTRDDRRAEEMKSVLAALLLLRKKPIDRLRLALARAR